MSSLLQMGHHSENLVGEKDLEFFSGLILSPVNRTKVEFISDIKKFQEKGDYKIFFDPQLYFPRSNRGSLPSHSYFPNDFDTSDPTNLSWWDSINKSLISYLKVLDLNLVISPSILPKKFTVEYYDLMLRVSDNLSEKKNDDTEIYTCVIIDPTYFENNDDVLRLASILSRSKAEGYYLVIQTGIEPRRELSDSNNLSYIMKLIHELSNVSGKKVIVSNCSSDMILFKSAGADYCASGKFFNLRRFTTSRYDEPSGGGGQLPYWFEHSLISFIREADILRLLENNKESFIGHLHSDNYWSNAIIEKLSKGTGDAWLAESWRQYLSWFSQTENDLSTEDAIDKVSKWLRDAERNWLELEDDSILLEEPRNNGSWIRMWRIALNDFIKYKE